MISKILTSFTEVYGILNLHVNLYRIKSIKSSENSHKYQTHRKIYDNSITRKHQKLIININNNKSNNSKLCVENIKTDF